MWLNDLFGFSLFGTQKHGKPDYATLKRIDEVTPIVYPKPDGVDIRGKRAQPVWAPTSRQ
jgi:electron-transferring-flavoprotein dehydrogenase